MFEEILAGLASKRDERHLSYTIIAGKVMLLSGETAPDKKPVIQFSMAWNRCSSNQYMCSQDIGNLDKHQSHILLDGQDFVFTRGQSAWISL